MNIKLKVPDQDIYKVSEHIADFIIVPEIIQVDHGDFQPSLLQEMYNDILTPDFIENRRKEIRLTKGRGHARATEGKYRRYSRSI